MLKDRRKAWQKDCLNFSWSRCGTIANYRTEKGRQKRIESFLSAGNYQTKFTFYETDNANRAA
tara:strand:- start:293 stop:481 length:189 start_codon:yes stop_codon:yes gene_type:complete